MKKFALFLSCTLLLTLLTQSVHAQAEDTYRKGLRTVSASVKYDTTSCSKESPLHVQFKNGMFGTVRKIDFYFTARY